jgi:hypothetical protein
MYLVRGALERAGGSGPWALEPDHVDTEDDRSLLPLVMVVMVVSRHHCTRKQLTVDDWGILYLGFSGRGTDLCLPRKNQRKKMKPKWLDSRASIGPNMDIIRTPTSLQTAARTLLEELPVVGPIDVWLADNQWFGVY